MTQENNFLLLGFLVMTACLADRFGGRHPGRCWAAVIDRQATTNECIIRQCHLTIFGSSHLCRVHMNPLLEIQLWGPDLQADKKLVEFKAQSLVEQAQDYVIREQAANKIIPELEALLVPDPSPKQ
jgi:hypothetical protein